MPTLNQLTKKRRQNKKRFKNSGFDGSPFKKGTCLRVYTLKPKKPNSAQRKVARVRLSNKAQRTVYIPGGQHDLQEHSIVLVKFGGPRDLPGVKHTAIRGKYNLEPARNLKHARSKYGIKKK